MLKEEINKGRLPKHIAIIMDGNGRWAKQHSLARMFGHKQGVQVVHNITEAAAELGIGYLTLYAFSTENWNRPAEEVAALMTILVDTVAQERDTLMNNNVRLVTIGDTDRLPDTARRKLCGLIDETSVNTGLTLVLALSYSSRWEITRMTRLLAEKVLSGEIKPEQITEQMVSDHLTTAGIPDPDLLIRTSGELRISNFLMWQLSYSELWFTDKLWPDFTTEDFYAAIVDYQHRERRFGKTSEQISNS